MADSEAQSCLLTEVGSALDAFEKGLGAYEARCVLLSPVINPDGSPVGVLEVVNRLDGVFDEEDEDLLRSLGSQVGVSAHLRI